jgi:parallel beta-helix repeat protein
MLLLFFLAPVPEGPALSTQTNNALKEPVLPQRTSESSKHNALNPFREAPASLAFDGVESIALTARQKAINDDLPPTTGDWIITKAATFSNFNITLNGNLVINAGGDLTLHNVTLIINCSYGGEFHIEINNGGILTITANSLITSNIAWCLNAFPGSTILLEESIFRHAGISWGSHRNCSGLWIHTNDTQVINCTFQENYGGLILYQTNNCRILNSTFNKSPVGIYLKQSGHTEVRHNIIANCSNGIELDTSRNDTISDNIITGSYDDGMYIDEAQGATIMGNDIAYSGDHGIFVVESSNIGVRDNIVTESRLYGLNMHQVDHSSLENNCIAKSGDDGILLVETAHMSANRNTVSNSGDDGIQVLNSNHCSICDSDIANSGDNGIAVQESDYATVSNNFIEGSGRFGIYIQNSTHYTLTNNTIYSSGGQSIFITPYPYTSGTSYPPGFTALALISLANLGIMARTRRKFRT